MSETETEAKPEEGSEATTVKVVADEGVTVHPVTTESGSKGAWLKYPPGKVPDGAPAMAITRPDAPPPDAWRKGWPPAGSDLRSTGELLVQLLVLERGDADPTADDILTASDGPVGDLIRQWMRSGEIAVVGRTPFTTDIVNVNPLLASSEMTIDLVESLAFPAQKQHLTQYHLALAIPEADFEAAVRSARGDLEEDHVPTDVPGDPAVVHLLLQLSEQVASLHTAMDELAAGSEDLRAEVIRLKAELKRKKAR